MMATLRSLSTYPHNEQSFPQSSLLACFGTNILSSRYNDLERQMIAAISPATNKRRRWNRLHFHFYPGTFRIEEGNQSRYEGGKPPMLSRESDADSYQHTNLHYHSTVRDLPTNERPRERLQHFGPQALSMARLLAIILRSGTRGDNAMELANKLLSKYGGLPGLVRADFRELCPQHRMGEAQSAQD